MPTINVYLADMPGTVAHPSPIRTYLQSAFNRVIQEHEIDATVSVGYVRQAPNINAHDLLCYIVRDRDDTLVRDCPGVGGNTSPPANLAGWTRFQTGNTGRSASEVYYDEMVEGGSGFGGRIVLHELMHNMSRVGDAMHRPGSGVGGETVRNDTALTATDMSFIARHLTRTNRTQWTGGFSLYNDPMRGI